MVITSNQYIVQNGQIFKDEYLELAGQSHNFAIQQVAIKWRSSLGS